MKEKSKEQELESVVIRFSGDSGDGMQMTGAQFSNTAAIMGNDISTFPDFPSEIRAPAGTVAGVSGYQVHLSSSQITTSGDMVDVLVAMNPAAVKANLHDLKKGGAIIVNTDAFTEQNLKLAGYEQNPLDTGELKEYQIIKANITSQTLEALKDFKLDHKGKLRCKNFYALGLTFFMFGRALTPTINWIEKKFTKDILLAQANIAALKAGRNFAETTDTIVSTYSVKAAKIAPGHYRQMSGNQATAWGLMQAAKAAGLNLFLGSYPITPATDILHELSHFKHFGVKTFQAEDEIAGICAAIGASFGGALALTTTSGPGLALKSEAIGLAVALELPLVIVDVQRGGPSTGLPTKTEQADLFQALYGRSGDCPLIVLSACRPMDCFHMAFEAGRLSIEHMTPVILLTDGYIANGVEPWRIPDLNKSYNHIHAPKVDASKPPENGKKFKPFERHPETLVRPWAAPGLKGFEHRIGGLEKKADGSGHVSYHPQDHQAMTDFRRKKVELVAENIPLQKIKGAESGELLVVSWGGTFGAVHAAVDRLQKAGKSVTHMNLSYINPMPKNVGDIIKGFKKILVPELNTGQMLFVLKAKFNCQAKGLSKVQGVPFTIAEIEQAILTELENA